MKEPRVAFPIFHPKVPRFCLGGGWTVPVLGVFSQFCLCRPPVSSVKRFFFLSTQTCFFFSRICFGRHLVFACVTASTGVAGVSFLPLGSPKRKGAFVTLVDAVVQANIR